MGVTITAADLATAIGSDAATAQRLLVVSTELIHNFTGLAPDGISNEACIRCSGWLLNHPSDGLVSNQVGDLTARYSSGSMLSPLKYSGAESLLSRYKVRRAGSA